MLLAQVGRHLCREAWNMHPGDLDFDPARLGRTYLERAVALDPNQRGARQTLDMAERERSSER